MKKQNFRIAALLFAAAAGMTMVACKKEKPAEETMMKIVDLSNQPVFFNEKPVESFSEIDYSPTKSADMELTCITDDNGDHYFDQDSTFFAFCTSNQMQSIYDNSPKLTQIHQKAVDLGLIDGDDVTYTSTMEEYWQEVFGTSISTSMNSSRALYAVMYDNDNWSGDYVRGSSICRAKLGAMDNKTSSFALYYGVGATVFCYEKWFGGVRRWIWLAGGNYAFSLSNHVDNNKYSSYFCVGL